MSEPVGVILVGGASARMGRDKAMLPLADRPMIEWVLEAARAALGEVVVVGDHTAPQGARAIADRGAEHRGPLSGIATALAILEAPIVALGVDQPFVRPETIRALARHGDPDIPAVPVAGGWEQVTCARYPVGWRDLAERELAEGGNIRNVLRRHLWTAIEEPVWRSWGEDGRSWDSLDTPDDVAAAERRYRMRLL